MNNKKIYYILILTVIILGSMFYFYVKPNIADNYATKAVKIYIENKDKAEDKTDQYLAALSYVEAANKWGENSSSLDILKGQLLIGLGRYDEAISHLEILKQKDPSSVMAVDELVKEILYSHEIS